MKRIMVVAGEKSGETHAAALIRELKQVSAGSPIEFLGLGGESMLQEGVELLFHGPDLAIIGTFEALPKLWKYYRCFKTLIRAAKDRKPDLVLLVDFPEFNLRLAGALKKLGFKIVYYISPQVWAWKKWRIEKIRKYVDKMLVILPFEKDFYRLHGVDVEYVGHPSAAGDALKWDRSLLRTKFGLPENQRIVALLPGSRNKEVKYILPPMLEAAKMIRSKIETHFVIAKARGVDSDLFADILRRVGVQAQELTIIQDHTHEVLSMSDLAIVKSGTSTVEALLAEIPFVITYRVSWLTWHVGSLFVDTPHYGLANLIAGERIVPELFQKEATPRNMATEALEILLNPEKAHAMRARLILAKEKLQEDRAPYRAALLVHSMLNPNSTMVSV